MGRPDARGHKSPGSDPRDKDLTARERRAIANENSGPLARRMAVIAGRARQAEVIAQQDGKRNDTIDDMSRSSQVIPKVGRGGAA